MRDLCRAVASTIEPSEFGLEAGGNCQHNAAFFSRLPVTHATETLVADLHKWNLNGAFGRHTGRRGILLSFLDTSGGPALQSGQLSLPLADPSSRTFRQGVTPEYLWLRDEAARCEEVAPMAKDVANAAEAVKLCNKNSACEFFNYVVEEKTAAFCRGDGYRISKPSAGTVVVIKPRTLALADMAVLTNQQALCPGSRLLAETYGVTSVDEAQRLFNANPKCSHWTLLLNNFPGPKGFVSRLQLCKEGMAAVTRRRPHSCSSCFRCTPRK